MKRQEYKKPSENINQRNNNNIYYFIAGIVFVLMFGFSISAQVQGDAFGNLLYLFDLKNDTNNLNLNHSLPISLVNGSGESILDGNNIKVNWYDAAGNPTYFYEDAEGNFYPTFHHGDVHRDWINHYFFRELNSYSIAVNSTIGDYNLTLNSTTGLSVGDTLHIGEAENHEHEPAQIISSVVGNIITLDRPLDKNHTVGELVYEISIDVTNVAGSIPGHVSYKCMPQYNQTWHIKKISVSCNDNSDMDFTNFCGEAALSNGIVFREYDGLTNNYRTYFVTKSNGDFIKSADSHDILSKTGGGEYSFNAVLDLSVVDVAFNINGDNGDFLEILIQDDLTAITNLNFLCSGHVEGQ